MLRAAGGADDNRPLHDRRSNTSSRARTERFVVAQKRGALHATCGAYIVAASRIHVNLFVAVLDGRMYRNHPAIMQADASTLPLEPDFLLELNGLRVPAEFDW